MPNVKERAAAAVAAAKAELELIEQALAADPDTHAKHVHQEVHHALGRLESCRLAITGDV